MPLPAPETPARPLPAPEPHVHGETIVYRLHDVGYEIRLEDGAGARLLVGESRQLPEATRRKLTSQRLSCFEDDLAVLTWNAALVVEPAAGDTDVQYVLECANAQLLELRFDDALLDAELPKINTRVAEARHRPQARDPARQLQHVECRVAGAAHRDAGDRHRPAHRLRAPSHAAGTLRGRRRPGNA